VYLLRLDPHLPWQPAAVEAAKRAMYDGFRAAVEGSATRSRFGIIVDARSMMVLRDAAAEGFCTVCTVPSIRSGRGETGTRHERPMDPSACAATYWRVVVRFNPTDDGGLTDVDLARLRRLSDDLRQGFGPRLLCDLVVAPTQWQLSHGIERFDRELLPGLTALAIDRLIDAGIVPALWTIEGVEQPSAYERIVAAAMCRPETAGCLVRAAGHSDTTTFRLMATGLATLGILGVVLGPAPFWEPAIAWMTGRSTRARAIAAIAEQFQSWIDRLEAARARTLTPHGDTAHPFGVGNDERVDAGT
jgi:hypothetical protein